MDWDRLITVEQMEAATNELLETGKKVGADSWQQRQESDAALRLRRSRHLPPHLLHGPLPHSPKAPRGIAAATSRHRRPQLSALHRRWRCTHSDHGRQICHTLYQAKEGGSYQVKDPEKLKKIAAEWGNRVRGARIFMIWPTKLLKPPFSSMASLSACSAF